MTIIEPIDLAQVKEHLRVSHNLDDEYITTLITTARQYVENYQGHLIAERIPDEGEEAPEVIPITNLEKHAMLLLIYNWYDNRSATVGTNVQKMPLGVESLLYFNREPEVLA